MTDERPDNLVRLVLADAKEVAPASAKASAARPAADLPREAPPAHHGEVQRPYLVKGKLEGPPPQFDEDGLPEACPVIPLGIAGGTYHFLDANRQHRELLTKEMSRLGVTSLYGVELDLLRLYYPRYSKEGSVTGWKPEIAAEALMKACARRGVWDVFGRMRGAGAWLGEDGGLVLHCGDVVLQIAREGRGLNPAGPRETVVEPGRIGRYVYPSAPSKPRPADAGGADHLGAGETLLELFRTWTWQRGELDAVLLLGWIGAAMVGGALDWRPLAWLTGDRGTGKSTLHKLLKWIFGDGLLAATDVSAAGIWQTLQFASLPLAIDELEADADNRKAQAVITLARIAASGGTIRRGGSDHKATEFTARSCFLFSSILVPPLSGQDRSRMAILELGPLGKNEPPEMSEKEMAALGRGLMRQVVDNWPRWTATLEAYRAALGKRGHGGRGADQFGTLLAAADMLLFGNTPVEDERLEKWCHQLKAEDLAEQDDNAPDHERFAQHLLSSVTDVHRNGSRRSIGELVRQAMRMPGDKDDMLAQHDAQRELATYGLKIVIEEGVYLLAVANAHQGLAKLFEGTHWGARSGTGGVWSQSARRVPDARRSKNALRFGEASSRAVLVPLKAIMVEEGKR
jgi:hypothetical protein